MCGADPSLPDLIGDPWATDTSAGCWYAAAAARQRSGDGRAVLAHRVDRGPLPGRLLARHRGYGTRTQLFDRFPDDVRWQWMAITPAELARVRYIDYDYWAELSGGTRLAVDAAPRIRAGVAPFRVSSDWVLGMAQAITDGARFPPLILVTTRTSGELVVLEGHARLTAFMLARDRLPPELEVLAGSSPAMTGWGLW